MTITMEIQMKTVGLFARHFIIAPKVARNASTNYVMVHASNMHNLCFHRKKNGSFVFTFI